MERVGGHLRSGHRGRLSICILNGREGAIPRNWQGEDRGGVGRNTSSVFPDKADSPTVKIALGRQCGGGLDNIARLTSLMVGQWSSTSEVLLGGGEGILGGKVATRPKGVQNQEIYRGGKNQKTRGGNSLARRREKKKTGEGKRRDKANFFSRKRKDLGSEQSGTKTAPQTTTLWVKGQNEADGNMGVWVVDFLPGREAKKT